MTFLIITFCWGFVTLVTSSSIDSILSPSFQAFVAKSDENGKAVFNQLEYKRERRANPVEQLKLKWRNAKPMQHKMDYVDTGRNLTYKSIKAFANTQNIAEIVIVVDKEFGDIFNHDYQRIIDYLTVYFWDVNMRYKSLPGVDITLRVNGLLIMADKQSQPFIEDSRNSEGKADFNKILYNFARWIYAQRSWLVKHDLAPVITATDLTWGGGLAYLNAPCSINDNEKYDLGVAVWNDDGAWGSVTVAAHEMGHNFGAPHDDDKEVNCPEKGFIMGGGDRDRRYLFSECSNERITKFVNSDQASCLRRIDGHSTTPMEPNFSSPTAPDMLEQCRRHVKRSDAWINAEDMKCDAYRCQWKDKPSDNFNYYSDMYPVENTPCPNGGKCFRGKCRKESMLLKNEKTGMCMYTKNHFGHMIQAQMGPCPSAKDRIPLETIQVIDSPNGKMLSTPYLEERNTVNEDRCFYTGVGDSGSIWTDKCNKENPWHGWEFRETSTGKFQLVHKVTGRCAFPASGDDGTWVNTVKCEQGRADMVWFWTQGN